MSCKYNEKEIKLIKCLLNRGEPVPDWLGIIKTTVSKDIYIVGNGGMGTLITFKAQKEGLDTINKLISDKYIYISSITDYMFELDTNVNWYEVDKEKIKKEMFL